MSSGPWGDNIAEVTHILLADVGWVAIEKGSLTTAVDEEGWDTFSAVTKAESNAIKRFTQYRLNGYCSAIHAVKSVYVNTALTDALKRSVEDSDCVKWDASI